MEWTGLFACDWCGWMPWNCTCAQWQEAQRQAAQSGIGARQPAERAALSGSVGAARTDTSPRILSRLPERQRGLVEDPIRARSA
jgi:hypothetical protein